jgi:hypothetical protein
MVTKSSLPQQQASNKGQFHESYTKSESHYTIALRFILILYPHRHPSLSDTSIISSTKYVRILILSIRSARPTAFIFGDVAVLTVIWGGQDLINLLESCRANLRSQLLNKIQKIMIGWCFMNINFIRMFTRFGLVIWNCGLTQTGLWYGTADWHRPVCDTHSLHTLYVSISG